MSVVEGRKAQTRCEITGSEQRRNRVETVGGAQSVAEQTVREEMVKIGNM